ncbi:class I SAM-dependent methyltransferase [Streptomyces griseoruber]|uniref:class I SAM-dependent methyltransferase n=1 Tax=Streptomyces griseoruber TaxID=1943 RepID=UPI00379BC048
MNGYFRPVLGRLPLLIRKHQTSASGRTGRYYRSSQEYLSGDFSGACHFGYTPPGQPFHLETALRAMEQELGKALALPHDSLVLDAGCGYGRVAATLADSPFCLNVVGVDLVPERLAEAHRYIESRGVSHRVELLNANYCFLPIEDGTVSAVFTMETLVHADPLEKALAEFWRVLKPGGRLVLFEYCVPSRDSVDPLRQWIAGKIAYHTGMASIERFTHDSFPILLGGANFENLTVSDIGPCVWPTWRWLFRRALCEYWAAALCGRFNWSNLAGALMIWPNRRRLGYKIVTATKPT